MIFKTINSSIDETRKTLALFNKDWDTYKRNWQNANGVFGKIGSIFTPANAITKSDIDAIKAYNSQIDSCVTSQTAFNRTMLNASPAAQNLVASYNGGKVSAQGMATAQNAAKASTIGLTIAQTALNAAIGMGIGLLVSLVVKGIDKLIHANEEAIEKAEELRRKYDEFKSTNESNVTTLKGLEKEFKELSKGVSQYGDNVSLTTEQYERYKEIIQQIVGMSPSLAEGYSTENGYIADKNGLLERAIELQEQEYRNELRKITNLDNLKTSMSGYIAEYKEAFDGGLVTDDMSATATREFTDLQNAIYEIFNTNNRSDFSSEDMIRQIMSSIGIENIEAEMAKYYNEYGYFQSQVFWREYADIIAENIEVITNSLSADVVGLDSAVFEQNAEKVDSAAQSYLDMKDAISMANESIQRDLGYIAEYADGYSELSTEQQKFVNEFLKGFSISNITSRDYFGNLVYDEDKMASVKSKITKFVEALSQDETTKEALADLYAIPTDEQSIDEFIEQFRNALEIIKAYCKENGIEIPIAISNSEQSINELEAQYQRVVDFAKDKFDGYDPTEFFKEHSINTQEEIDAWQKIAQGARDAAEAEKEYVQSSTLNDKNPISITPTISSSVEQLATQLEPQFAKLGEAYKAIFTTDGFTLDDVDNSMLEDLRKSFAEIEEEVGVAFDSTKLDPFFDALTSDYASSEEGARKVQDAFNELATAYFYSTETLEQLNAETADAIEKQLEEMGVQNAAEVVADALTAKTEELIVAKEYLAETGKELASATEEEQTAFILEQIEAGNCGEALALLQLKKVLVNSTQINTTADIQQIMNLASAAGMGAEVLTQLANAKSILGTVEAGGSVSLTSYQKALDDVEAAKQTMLDWKPVELDFNNVGGGASKAGSAGSSAGDAYVDAFEAELEELQRLRDDGVITEKEYLDRLRTLYEKYFKDKLGYEKEFSKYQRQYLEGYKSLYESALSSISKLMSHQIDGYSEAKEAAVSSLTEEKEARLEVINVQKEQLEAEKDLIDEEIKAKQKIIDGIQDEIDAMKEARAERQRQIDLQKAQYELERMQHQRTMLVNYMPDTIVI